MKLKDFNFNHQETHIYFYVPKELIGDFAKYELRPSTGFP